MQGVMGRREEEEFALRRKTGWLLVERSRCISPAFALSGFPSALLEQIFFFARISLSLEMTGVCRLVSNMFLFLFVLRRAEEDMVSTNAYFLARHEGILKNRHCIQRSAGLRPPSCVLLARWKSA